MSDEKRMIENFEVRHSTRLGDREIVVGIDLNAQEPYMICDVNQTMFHTQFEYAMVSDDYLEIMEEYTKRIKTQIDEVRIKRKEYGVDHHPFTMEHCIPHGMAENLSGKVVIISPKTLRPEYATTDCQLLLAKHGNGCRPDARGQAVFGTNLGNGKTERWERYDLLGVADMTKLPQWALEQLEKIKTKEKQERSQER